MNDSNDLSETSLINLSGQVGEMLEQHQLLLTTAESCTGGWVSQVITAVEGSSHWYERGFVTYSNAAKKEMLGVSAATLAAEGAVSEATVTEMAKGALQHSHAQIAVAVSGIAGPGGGNADKPVGTVCFAWAREGDDVLATTKNFEGDRKQVRQQAVAAALKGVMTIIKNLSRK